MHLNEDHGGCLLLLGFLAFCHKGSFEMVFLWDFLKQFLVMFFVLFLEIFRGSLTY